jgi:hypothetical protein|tara:strand:+ start:729 stop:839 length:111 start_codon:yes stop_codon:yes gene_type:complete
VSEVEESLCLIKDIYMEKEKGFNPEESIEKRETERS